MVKSEAFRPLKVFHEKAFVPCLLIPKVTSLKAEGEQMGFLEYGCWNAR